VPTTTANRDAGRVGHGRAAAAREGGRGLCQVCWATDCLWNSIQIFPPLQLISAEQCRHFLLRNGFDVDKAVQELKVEKLLEMGLATDRAAATSVLDCEQWDVNAAANRLCCS